MSPQTARNEPTPAASKALQTHDRRLQDPQVGRKVWDGLLTPEERTRLGSFEEAYSQGYSVGIYVRAKDVTWERAVVEIARALGMPEVDYNWLMGELGQSIPVDRHDGPRPVWNRARRELRFQGEVIRKLSGQAHNCIRVLDVFEESGWPSQIDDPNSPGRLANTVKSLNRQLTHIKFGRDGSGEVITWQPLAD